MPVRVHIKNFQSIADATLTIDGFTVITGANNSGKTAVIRAVQGALSNAPGDAFVRHGADRLSVELSFDDGQSVKWEKGPKVKPTYHIGGKTLHPGRTVPEEVSALGIRPVLIGQVPVWPQIAKQFTGQVFLLDLPGSSVAEAVADVDRVGRLTQALRFADSDKRAATTDLRVRRQDVETGKREVEAYDGVEAVVDAVASIDTLVQEAREVTRDGEALKILQGRLQASRVDIRRFSGVREVLVPDSAFIEAVVKLKEKLKELHLLRARIIQARRQVQGLSPVRNITLPEPPAAAEKARSDIRALTSLQARMAALRLVVTRARGASDVLQGARLPEMMPLIAAAAKAGKTWEYALGLRSRLTAGRAEVTSLRETLRAKLALLADSEIEVRDALAALGVCPVCQTNVPGSAEHGVAEHG